MAYKVDGQRLAPGQMPSTLNGLSRVEVEYETMPGWQTDISQGILCRLMCRARPCVFVSDLAVITGVCATSEAGLC